MNVSEAPRHIRQAAYKQERTERATGKWSPWHRAPAEQLIAAWGEAARAVPDAFGWTRQVHSVWTNGWACVMVRTIDRTALGMPVDHVAFRTALGAELGWKEKQRIKDELFGLDRMAIEVYPRASEKIDAAAMYHLWVFPAGFRFDFGLGEGQQ